MDISSLTSISARLALPLILGSALLLTGTPGIAGAPVQPSALHQEYSINGTLLGEDRGNIYRLQTRDHGVVTVDASEAAANDQLGGIATGASYRAVGMVDGNGTFHAHMMYRSVGTTALWPNDDLFATTAH